MCGIQFCGIEFCKLQFFDVKCEPQFFVISFHPVDVVPCHLIVCLRHARSTVVLLLELVQGTLEITEAFSILLLSLTDYAECIEKLASADQN